MREKLAQLCAAALLLLLGCGGQAVTTDAQVQSNDRPDRRVVAFVNVNVVPMDSERVLAGQTVVVRGEQIAEVGPVGRVKVPPAQLCPTIRRQAQDVDGAPDAEPNIEYRF